MSGDVGRCCARCKTPYGCARSVCACHARHVEARRAPVPAPVDPDCRDGKHTACPGWTFNLATDDLGSCTCACHTDHKEAA